MTNKTDTNDKIIEPICISNSELEKQIQFIEKTREQIRFIQQEKLKREHLEKMVESNCKKAVKNHLHKDEVKELVKPLVLALDNLKRQYCYSQYGKNILESCLKYAQDKGWTE